MNASLPRLIALACLSTLALAGCSREPAQLSYSRDVVPVLDKHCKACHVPGQPGYQASGFDLVGYDALMKGTRYGPVIVPGDPLTSALVMLIEGRVDPSIRMPHGGRAPMSADEIRTIRTWVEQGAKNN